MDGIAKSVVNVQYLVGAEVAADAAKTLLPAAFALASGALRGIINTRIQPHPHYYSLRRHRLRS